MGYDAEFQPKRTQGVFGARGLKAAFGARSTRASFTRLVPLRSPDANALLGGTTAGSASLAAYVSALILLIGSASAAASTESTLSGRSAFAGSTAGSSSTSATLCGNLSGTGTASASATTSAALKGVFVQSGTVAGHASLSAAIAARAPFAAGSTQGTATTVATFGAPAFAAGTADGTGTITGALTARLAAAGTAAGTATASGAVVNVYAFAGSASGSGTVAGSIVAGVAASGSTAGSATVSGGLSGGLTLAGIVAGSGTTSGTEVQTSIPADAILDSSGVPITDSAGVIITYDQGPLLTGLSLNLDAGDPASYSGTGTTWLDLSGNGKNATLNGGPTFSALAGGSIVFDGTDDYAQLPGNIQASNNNYSIEAWFYPTALPTSTDYNYAVCVVGNRGQYDWLFTFGDGTSSGSSLGFRLYDAVNSWATPVQTDALSTNTWHQVIVTSSSVDGIKLYKNGSLVATNATIRNVGSGSGSSRIADETFGVNRHFNGRVSIVRFYDQVLTSTDVARNWNTVKGRYALT